MNSVLYWTLCNAKQRLEVVVRRWGNIVHQLTWAFVLFLFCSAIDETVLRLGVTELQWVLGMDCAIFVCGIQVCCANVIPVGLKYLSVVQ